MGVCCEWVLWAKRHAWGFTYISLLNYNNLGCRFEDEETELWGFQPKPLQLCANNRENRRQPKASQPNLSERTLERKWAVS